MKKEIPILYSTAMAKAKVEMRKTQTRRIIDMDDLKDAPDRFKSAGDSREWDVPRPAIPYDDRIWFAWELVNSNAKTWIYRCRYKPGDLLWGRESWGYTGWFYKKHLEYAKDKPLYRYRATHQENIAEIIPWKPSIHMPKEAARIWDEVISVRVERVADISDADCIAEGLIESEWTFTDGTKHKCYKDYSQKVDDQSNYYSIPRNSYRSLWQLLNGKPKAIQQKQNGKLITTSYIVYPFDAEAGKEFEGLTTWKGKPLTVVVNPWVWVIETKQLSVTGKPSSEPDSVHRY